jgi:lipopolysaccharide export system protein LptA
MSKRAVMLSAILLSTSAFAAVRHQKPTRIVRQDASGNKSKALPPGKDKSDDIQVAWATFEHNDATGLGEMTKMDLTDQETKVFADHAKWNDKKKQAESAGNVRMSDPQADATGEKATIFYAKSKKLLVLVGSVQINVKPRDEDQPVTTPKTQGPAPVVLKDGKATVGQEKLASSDDDQDSPRKHPTVVTCDKVEYQYAKDKKHGVLTGHLKAVQQLKDNTRTITADHGEWFGLEDRLVLFSPVHYEDTKGTSMDPKGEVTIHTKKGDEWIKTGPGTATFHSDEADEDIGKKEKPADKKPVKKQ